MPRSRLHPLLRLLLCLGASTLAVVLTTLVIWQAVVTASTLSGQAAEEQAAQFLHDNAALGLLLCYPAVLLCLYASRRLLDRRSFVSLGLRRRRSLRDFGGGVLCGALTTSFLCGVLWLCGAITLNGWAPDVFTAPPMRTAGVLAGWALFFGCIGFMEEVGFRGYFFHNLAAWLGRRNALLCQAVIFASVHFPQTPIRADALRAMPNLALLGAFFALCYLRTGSLWFPIGFHTAWNFFLGCIFSLPVSGEKFSPLLDVSMSSNDWLTGGTFGAEGSIILLVIAAVMVYLVWRAPTDPQARLDLELSRIEPETIPLRAIEAPSPVLVEEPHLSRFKTTMRSQQTETVRLPEVLLQTPSPFSPTLAPFTPVTATPVVTTEIAPPIMAQPEPVPSPTWEPLTPMNTPITETPITETPSIEPVNAATDAPSEVSNSEPAPSEAIKTEPITTAALKPPAPRW